MTAAAVDPAIAIVAAGRELLDALRELVDRDDPSPALLDEVTALLRRARGKVGRATRRGHPRPVSGAPAVEPKVGPATPSGVSSSNTPASAGSTEPKPAAAAPARVVTLSLPRTTPTAERTSTKGAAMSQPHPAEQQPPANRRTIGKGYKTFLACAVAAMFLLMIIAVSTSGDSGTDDQSTMAEVMCEDFVKARLKSPGSAEFGPTDTAREDDVYTVRGPVDSQNGFGAMLRSDYVCVVRDNPDDSWNLVDISINQR